MSDEPGDFGQLLRRHRRAAGLTQAALAEAAGLSEQAIGLLERGVRRRPYRATVLALADVLQLGPEDTSALVVAAHGPAETVASDGAPRQLPPDTLDFVGRAEELGLIAQALKKSAAVVVLHGLAGVGKTTLAVHAAHLAAGDFPDGQLYIDLQGYGPGSPLTASAALRVLLVSLGMREQAVPVDVDAASKLYRAQLAGRRMLVVLDNASDPELLDLLLPEAPRCVALVTGRRALGIGTSLEVTPLDDVDSLAMLGSIIGSKRVGAEVEAARTIVRTSHGLPLIVRLVGARLDQRLNWELAQLARQIGDAGRGIDHLGVTAAVQATVTSSLEHLLGSPDSTGPQAAAAFDFLGLIDTAELSQAAVGALLDLPAAKTEAVMAHLVDLHLVGSPQPGGYRLHDLLRAVAGERAARNLSADERRLAVLRVAELYTLAAWRCHKLTHKTGDRIKLTKLPVGEPSVDSLPARLAWLDAERASIVALIRQLGALGGGFADPLIELGYSLFGYFDARARWPEMREVAIIARAAARTAADQAYFEYYGGIADWEQDRFEAALTRFTAGLSIAEQGSDTRGVVRCAFAVARTFEHLGRLEEAIPFAERAIEASRESGYEYGLGSGLLALGALHARVGRVAEAESCFEQSIGFALADDDLRAAARREGTAGDTYADTGNHELAIAHFRASLNLYVTAPGPACNTFVHRRLGTSLLARGELESAAEAFDAALALAREGANKSEEAKVLADLADLQLARGQSSAAVESLNIAADLFDELGRPESAGIRARLATLTQK
ncbi:helix-turn-helix domain-containing protein [Kribbella sp. NPDC051718]|uniref:helix-turn-helix domain-containing protein n=1 Tax=Kribbella sp. NPDC051718 TaxID=3155168 RepID=UPI003440FD6D